MEFVANFMTTEVDPAVWARRRETEGWQVVGCADHIFSSARTYPHVWVTLAVMAAATERVGIATSFANNLLRSPVEFAQAALQLQAVSGGRFEAGLGSGWEEQEIRALGLAYPTPGQRAARYREAVTVAGRLLRERCCRFAGDFYDIDVPTIGPAPAGGPPPLVASLGGPRTIREISPLVDRIELKPISSATRGGRLDITGLRDVTEEHVAGLVEQARRANPDAPLGIFILCAVGSDERAGQLAETLEGTFMGGFFGAAPKVAASMLGLADLGLERVQVSPFDDSAFEQLAAELPLAG